MFARIAPRMAYLLRGAAAVWRSERAARSLSQRRRV